MDSEETQLQLKETLVSLEDQQYHLKASVKHLEHEVKKRELEVQKLLSERELELTKNNPGEQSEGKTNSETENSSAFAKQVGRLLSNISRTSEDISSMIKL